MKDSTRPLWRFAVAGFSALTFLLFSSNGWSQVANDNLVDAQDLGSATAGSEPGNNVGAASEFGEPDHANVSYGIAGSASIWYEWTAPATTFATFDTLGSDFNTVLAVYSGTNVNALTRIEENDDAGIGVFTSQLTFRCVAGGVYKIAIAGYGGTSGNTVLNWQTADALSPGRFEFTTNLFEANAWECTNTAGANLPGARISVVRRGGTAGQVLVDYVVTNDVFITNYNVTEIVLTNMVETNLHFTFMQIVAVSSTNIFGTNVFTNASFLGRTTLRRTLTANIDSHGTNVVFDPLGPDATIFGTNIYELSTFVNCTNWGVITNYQNEPFTNDFFTNGICVGSLIDSNGVLGDVLFTNYSFTVTNYSAVPGSDYIPDAGTLTFDDFQMSQHFLVKLKPRVFDSFFLTNYYDTNTFVITNVAFIRIMLSNPRFGAAEDVPTEPTLTAGKDEAFLLVTKADAGFNFRRRLSRIGEGGNARIEVQRSFPFNQSVSVHYRFNFRGATRRQYQLATFPLQAGSDYARPYEDADVPTTSPVDFEKDEDFPDQVLRWNANDPNPKYIDVPALDDSVVEFSEDLQIELFKLVGETDGFVGAQWWTTLSILNNDLPAGSVDTGYNSDDAPRPPQPGANRSVFAVAVQPDDRAIIGGDFSSFDGTRRDRIARLQANGQLDTSFNPGGGFDGFVTSLLVQPDGKIVAAGGFTSYNGATCYGIARVNANGTFDSTFEPIPGVNEGATVWATALTPDGKILIGGDFTLVNGTNRNYIARLNSDGSLDTTFDPGVGPNAPVLTLDVTTNGNVLIGGYFESVAGTFRRGIAQLTPTGALDPAFEPGGGAEGTVFALKVQPDGKVVVGGSFHTFDFLPRNSITRLNSDGSLDLGFDVGSGADDTIFAISIQQDGGIVVGGIFTSINSTRRVGIARLLPQGWVDTSFMDNAHNQFAGLPNRFHSPLLNSKNYVLATALESNGNVIIGGGFMRVGGGGPRDAIRPRSNVARLIGGSTRGPGNIDFGSGSYSGDANDQNLYITLVRRNGDLGPAQVTFSPETLPLGPGAAEDGLDFSFDASAFGTPSWGILWQADNGGNRNRSDGVDGPHAGTAIRLLDRGVVHGDVAALLRLANPVTTDVFELGGEYLPLGPALGRTTAELSIIDRNSLAGTISFSSVSYVVTEDATNAVLMVIRTNGSAANVTVRYATASGGCTVPATSGSGGDYSAPLGNAIVTFGRDETNKLIYIPINNDSHVESDECFTVQLLNPTGGATIGLASAVVTIIDNDFLPGRINLQTSTYKASEGTNRAAVTVTRSGGVSGVVTVQFATSNLTANAGVDYVATNGVLTWNNGDAVSKTFYVPIVPDDLVEGDENVRVRIFGTTVNGVNNLQALGSLTNATLSIEDDDFYGELNFNAADYRVNENGGAATITVIRVGGLAQTITVNYLATNGTAVAPADFTSASGTLTFAPGEVSKSFTVFLRDNLDGDVDPLAPRVINLELSNANPAASLGDTNTATLTIVDDESFNESPGSLDTDYDLQAGANNFIYSGVLQTDGRLVIGGDFTQVNGVARNRIARLNQDGSLDSTFSSAFLGPNGTVRTVFSQSDNRILMGGAFNIVNGTNRSSIARLNYNGTLDETFNPGSGADSSVYVIKEAFSGAERQVLVGGSFSTFNQIIRHGIVRLKDTGAVDLTFNPGSGANGVVYAIAVQQDGKVLVGGTFTTMDNVARGRIARLNADGSLDATFNSVGANNAIRDICVQFDGKILIGGLFTLVNGVSRSHIARLNADGSLDTSFNPGVGANDAVYAIKTLVDGKVLLGGEFTKVNGVTRNRITRLNSDGTADPTINFGTGANSFVSSLAVQNDGKIILTGGFTEYNEVARPYLARIYGGAVDGVGKLEFTAADYRVSETTTNVTITIRRVGGTKGDPGTGDVSVDLASTGITAQGGLDYADISTNIVFPFGEVVRSVTVPLMDDGLIEDDETAYLSLSVPTGELTQLGNQPSATLTIVSDESAISFGAVTFRGYENVLGGVIPITVVRTGDPSGISSVECISRTNGTATVNVDYTPFTNLVTFVAGETEKIVFVPVTDDIVIEGNETFEIELRNVNGSFLLAPIVATMTIIENEAGPGSIGFLAPTFTVIENATNARISVIRTNGAVGTVSVNYVTSSGSAAAGVDYVHTNGVVVFTDGEASKDILVQVIDNSFVQAGRVFNVNLFNPTGGATLLTPTNVPVTITDNEVALRFSTPAYIVGESNTINITVLRENGSNGTVQVNYRTVPSTPVTAETNVDYTPVNGTLTFAPGETVKSFAITTVEDDLIEGDESFNVILSDPTGGALIVPPPNATVTIVDNDSAFHFSSEAFSVDEFASNVVVTVVRTNASTGTVSVRFATGFASLEDGNLAVGGSDYVSTNGILTFEVGESVKTFTVPILNDTLVEGEEVFRLTLSNPTGGARLGAITNALVTIGDDDAGISFSASGYAVAEHGVSVTINVNRSNLTNSEVSVDYSAVDGTAVAGSDFQPVSGNLIFAPGETNKTFTVTLIDDTLEEGNETVLLKLSNSSTNASLVNPSAATLTILDNDGSAIVAAGSHLLSESGPVNQVIDTNETVTLLLALRNVGLTNTANLTATILATNGITSPSSPQNYGRLVTNGASVSRPFTFTTSGTNGQRISVILQLQDGATNYDRAIFSFSLGTAVTRFTNTSSITLNDNSPASPYPSTITVSGVDGDVTKVTATITNINHTYPDDIDVLLVGPSQQKVILMSDAGGNGGTPLNFVTLTFDDAASGTLPDAGQIVTGTYKPTDFETADNLTNPAPVRPYATSFAGFNGSNPNGTWALYAQDDTFTDAGTILGGWVLAITTSSTLAPSCDLSVAVTASSDPIVLSNNITYTISVTNHGPSPATGVTLTNILPTGATFVSATGSYTTNGNRVIHNLGGMSKDAATTVTMVVRADVLGTLTNTTTVTSSQTDPNPDNNLALITSAVSIPRADVAVSVIGLPNPVPVRGTLTYSILVTNAGPAVATGVILTNVLPPGMSNLIISPTGTVAGGVVTCNLGNMAAGSSVSISITGTPTIAGTFTNISRVGSPIIDPLKGNNTASVKTTVEAPQFTVVRSGAQLTISWPAAATGYILESATNLVPPVVWQPVTTPPSAVGGQNSVSINTAVGQRQFFRLKK